MVKHRKTSKRCVVKRSKIKGLGAFASCDIRKGQKVVEYLGTIITKDDSDRIADEEDKAGNFYLFNLSKDFDINGGENPNEGPFLNHSCDPNVEAVNEDNKHIWLYSLRSIKKGDELCYDYGLEADMADPKMHPCKCGSSNCRGLIIDEQDFKKYLKMNPKYKKKWDAKMKLKNVKKTKKRTKKR